MATKKAPTGEIANAVVVDGMLAAITSKLSLDQMRLLHTALVDHINMQQRRQRSQAADQFSRGDIVAFDSRNKGNIRLKVEKVTPAGILYGITPEANAWKVSATLCKKISAAQYNILR